MGLSLIRIMNMIWRSLHHQQTLTTMAPSVLQLGDPFSQYWIGISHSCVDSSTGSVMFAGQFRYWWFETSNAGPRPLVAPRAHALLGVTQDEL